jgi:sterol desaturase/sphingolipid hydroxylase (fatty acid hydroxylase superfamily)
LLSRLASGETGWILAAVFWVTLIVLAAAETWRPLRADGAEPAGRIPGNIGMGLINAAIAFLLPVSTVFSAQWAARHGIGLLNQLSLPATAAAAATVAVRSLATYMNHCLSHRLPWLWRIHRVHHSDTALDLSTGFRNHPLELAVLAPWLAIVTIGFGLDPLTLLAYETVAVAFALWDHANFRLPRRAERVLRTLVVTPAMHQLHHSAVQAETDSNYGDVFSLWDRLFGTYRSPDEAALAAMRIGLGDAFDAGAASLVHQLRLPLATEPAARTASSES